MLDSLDPLPSQDVVRGTLVIKSTEIDESTIGAAYGMLEALVGPTRSETHCEFHNWALT